MTEFSPMPVQPLRVPALLKTAKDYPCMRCGTRARPRVAAHYCGVYSWVFGKGGSQKASDHMVAILCDDPNEGCHQFMDQYLSGNNQERGLEFMILIAKTWHAWLLDGVLVVRK